QFQLKQGQGEMVRLDKWLMPAEAGVANPGAKGTLAWDKPVDPDGDCKFQENEGKLTITVPAKPRLLSVEGNNKNSPRLLSDLEGDFTVQVRIGGDFTLAATTSDGGNYSWIGAGLLLWVDENTFLRLERAKWAGRPDWPSYVNWEVRENGKVRGPKHNVKLSAAETNLRLERQGKRILASYSEDGQNWSKVTSLDIALPSKIKIGVLAGSNTAGVFASTFDQFKLKQGQGEWVRIDKWLMPPEGGTKGTLTWDKPTDPKGKCKFQEAAGKLTVTIPHGNYNLSPRHGIAAPRLLGNVAGDFTAQVRVGGAYRDDGKGEPFFSLAAGLIVWIDENNYLELERGLAARDKLRVLWSSHKDGRPHQHPAAGLNLTGTHTHLRLQRRGNKLLAAYSEDGNKWVELNPIEMPLP